MLIHPQIQIVSQIILIFLIVATAIYIVSTTVTIRCLISFVLLIVELAFLLQLNHSPFYAILYLLTYIGAILVFFIFMVMLVDTRFEKPETPIEVLAKI